MATTYLRWDDYQFCIYTLVRKIQTGKFHPTHIAGIPRGGLIPAVSLSYQLENLNPHENRLVSVENLFTRGWMDAALSTSSVRVLLVDDVFSGDGCTLDETCEHLREKSPQCAVCMAALAAVRGRSVVSGMNIEDGVEVRFPWEVGVQYTEEPTKIRGDIEWK